MGAGQGAGNRNQTLLLNGEYAFKLDSALWGEPEIVILYKLNDVSYVVFGILHRGVAARKLWYLKVEESVLVGCTVSDEHCE